MSNTRHAVRWPPWVDPAVTAGILLVVWFGTRQQTAESDLETAVDSQAELLVCVVAFLLLGARTRPWPAVLAMSTGAAVYLALGYPGGPVLLVPWVGLLALTLGRGPREGWAAAGASVAMITLGSVVAGTWDHWARLLLVTGWSAAAVLAGELLGRRMDAAHARRRWVERRRDEEAMAERLRIARDAHDGLGHALSLISIQARVARQTAPEGPTAVALEVISETTTKALDDLGAMVTGLRGPVRRHPVDSLRDVEPALERARAAGDRLHWSVALCQEWPGPVQSAAFRVVQEALTNARRHAPEAAVRVELTDAEGPLTVVVNNERADMSVESRGDDRDGLGLVGMNERVVATGGAVAAGEHPAGGWEVRAEWWPRR